MICATFKKLKTAIAMINNENSVINIDESDEEEEDPIDDEQLEEYREMVDQLGFFPVSNTHHELHSCRFCPLLFPYLIILSI